MTNVSFFSNGASHFKCMCSIYLCTLKLIYLCYEMINQSIIWNSCSTANLSFIYFKSYLVIDVSLSGMLKHSVTYCHSPVYICTWLFPHVSKLTIRGVFWCGRSSNSSSYLLQNKVRTRSTIHYYCRYLPLS